MRLNFKKRSVVHMVLTLIASFYLAVNVAGVLEFILLGVPVWVTIYFLVKVALEPFEVDSTKEQQ